MLMPSITKFAPLVPVSTNTHSHNQYTLYNIQYLYSYQHHILLIHIITST